MARILLAESDDSMRSFLTKALERGGHQVHAVPDAGAAVDALTAAQAVADDGVELLLTEATLPPGPEGDCPDGIELARRAAELAPAIKIMFITGFAAQALSVNCPTQGSHTLAKPFHLRQLVDEVNRVMPAASQGRAP